MADLLFYFLSSVTVVSALAVVFNRNTVASALSFFISLCGVAGLFVMLDAYLLAFLLILVYAGAVVALFLFIVMLLDMQGGRRKSFTPLSIVAGGLAAALLVVGVWSFAAHTQSLASAQPSVLFNGALREYGAKLFTTYLLPVQVVGFLLLIAMLGVIVLSKKFESAEGSP